MDSKKYPVCQGLYCSSLGSLCCSRCRLVFYCSVKCQKTHWKEHKRGCTESPEAAIDSVQGAEVELSSNATTTSNVASAFIANSKSYEALPLETSDLSRFVEAQSQVYTTARSEMENGRKESHWIWFIIPQRAGLGFSPQSKFYGLKNDQEISDYIQHPLLGPNYFEIVGFVHRWIVVKSREPLTLMGSEIDVEKLKSSLGTFYFIAQVIARKEASESLILFIQQADEIAARLDWKYVK